MNHLDAVVSSQKAGQLRGITSVCSAHPFVLEAALRNSLQHDTPLLIEATCNQVNQFGGYTGMKPVDFIHFVKKAADRAGFPKEKLILGGDHLGPLVWSNEPADIAMDKAKKLVHDYALAGYGKLHLDCSMPCADDREFNVEIIAGRTAELARVVENTCAEAGLPLPRYVVGTEVPPAGGAKAGDEGIHTTDPAHAAETIESIHLAFEKKGLDPAWGRVIALVVQPGVEFGDSSIHEYDRAAAVSLTHFIEGVKGIVFEAHSTDYQTREALRQLVQDHYAILKVGPGLTYAFREGVFALAEMEVALSVDTPSRIRETLEEAMLQNPKYWVSHYAGSPEQKKFSRVYSYSDRIRYYWALPEVTTSFNRLLINLGKVPLPLSLVNQYLPKQYEKIRTGMLPNEPRALLLNKITDVLDDYAFACRIK